MQMLQITYNEYLQLKYIYNRNKLKHLAPVFELKGLPSVIEMSIQQRNTIRITGCLCYSDQKLKKFLDNTSLNNPKGSVLVTTHVFFPCREK